MVYPSPWPQQPAYAPPLPAGTPGSVTAARVILWLQGGLWTLSAVGLLIAGILQLTHHDLAAEGDSAGRTGYALGSLLPMAFFGALAIFALTIAAKLRAGASGARVCALVLEGCLLALGAAGLLISVIVLAAEPSPAAVVLILVMLAWLALPAAVLGCLLTGRARDHLTRRV
jgi:hypothetical protein